MKFEGIATVSHSEKPEPSDASGAQDPVQRESTEVFFPEDVRSDSSSLDAKDVLPVRSVRISDLSVPPPPAAKSPKNLRLHSASSGRLSLDSNGALRATSSHSSARMSSELSEISERFSSIYSEGDDDELNKEYVRMSRHVVVKFQEVTLESAYQEEFLRKRRQWAAFSCGLVAVLCLCVALTSCAPPYDRPVLIRRVTGFVLAVGVLSFASLSYFGGSFAQNFNRVFYDPLLTSVSLVIIFMFSMTSDRTAKQFDIPDQTWSLVPMQETTFNMCLVLSFSFLMFWLNLRLHWILLTYVIGIPMSICLMLQYGSLSFDLEIGADEYHYDADGNSTTHQFWAYEQFVIVRALLFSLLAICAYVTARRQEVNDRYAFARNYFLCQRIKRHRRLYEAQIEVNENRYKKMMMTYSLAPARIEASVVAARGVSKRIDIAPIPDTNVVDQEILTAPTPNAKLASDLARCTGETTYLRHIADSIRDPSYSLQMFYADCQKCLPEFLLCRGHELGFQQTVGSLFNVYWLLRLDLEGREGFCLGVDNSWNPNEKPREKIRDGNIQFSGLTEDEKRHLYLTDLEWAGMRDLVSHAGCGPESSDVAENISSLLSLIAICNLLRNSDYHPDVAPEHSPYQGYVEGSTIDNRILALRYYLEYYPHLFPSFTRLSPASQHMLRLSLLLDSDDFDLLKAAQAEYPSGAKFSSFKAEMTSHTRSVDIAMHILSWLVRLAAASGNPFGGAENLLFNIAPLKLSSALRLVPHILKLPRQAETEIDEDCLQSLCTLHGVTEICQEGRIASLMRIAIMAREDASEFIEVLSSLPQEAQQNILEELSYSGVAGQFYSGSTENVGGPAFILEGLPKLMRRYSGDTGDVFNIFLVVDALLRAARVAWPLEKDLQGTRVTLQLDAFTKEDLVTSDAEKNDDNCIPNRKPVELAQLLQPSNGELWALIGGKGACVGLLESIRPARLNQLQSAGTHFQVLDFLAIQDHGAKLQSIISHTRPNLHGKWKCIETFGLDDFLKAMGTGWVQRAAATKAPWPTWVFKQEEDQIAFINQSAMGDLREDILVDGPEYIVVDGWKRQIKCKASWDGSSLIIWKSGPEGEFCETRTVNQDELMFKIQNAKEDKFPEWGRKFKRIS